MQALNPRDAIIDAMIRLEKAVAPHVPNLKYKASKG